MARMSDKGPSTHVSMYKEDVDLLDSIIERTGRLNGALIKEGQDRVEWFSRKSLIMVRKDTIHHFSGNGKESFYSHPAKAHTSKKNETIMLYQQDCVWFDDLAQKMNFPEFAHLPARKAQLAARKELFHRLVCYLDGIYTKIFSEAEKSLKGAQADGETL